jgi:hypothetical protein
MTDHFDLAEGRNRPDENADVTSGPLDEQYEADDADEFDDDEAHDEDDQLEDDGANRSGDDV